MKPLYLRRIQQLIGEVQSENPTYDQSSKMLMRVISNYAMFDADIGSQKAKEKNVYVSVNAKQLLKKLSFEDWHKETRNEHQLPLKEMWDQMIANKNNLTEKEIWNQFRKFPMVTVTKSEHKILATVDSIAKKGNETLTPKERYKRAGIEITRHD